MRNRFRMAGLALLTVPCALAQAAGPGGWVPVGIPRQVSDINADVVQTGAWIQEILAARDATYFVGFEPHVGYELWKTDGTTDGTTLVADVVPGSQSSWPAELTEVGGTLFFTVQSGFGGLWRSDGTRAGTVAVAPDLRYPALQVGELSKLGGTLLFTASDPDHGWELWKSDGTEAGTVLVKDIAVGTAASSPSGLTEFDGAFFFTADDGVHGRTLWTSDGTERGTVPVKDLPPASAGTEVIATDGALFFFARAGEGTEFRQLWVSDGTGEGTRLVEDLPAPGYAGVGANGRLFFVVGYGDWRYDALWSSDGTEAGTLAVKDSGVFALEWAAVNGTLYFRGSEEGSDYATLWKSDGTRAGTTGFSPEVFYPSNFVASGGIVFFAGFDAVHGSEPWKSDGTDAGTSMVRDIAPGVADGAPPFGHGWGTTGDGRILFTADDGVHGPEPWITDGTDAGTSLLADLNAGTESSELYQLAAVGRTLFFGVLDFEQGGYGGLWKSDGTPGGTTLVASNAKLREPHRFADLGGTLFFSAKAPSVSELWKSDGTEAGTVRVGPTGFLERATNPSWLTDVGGILFFAASKFQLGAELWRSDGTEAGTFMVRDIRPYPYGSEPRDLTAVGGTLFFTADDGVHGRRLWTSDGTEAGTVMVGDIIAGSLTEFAGALFFVGPGGLWTSDGTEAGTVMVHEISVGEAGYVSQMAAVGTTLFFATYDGVHGAKLWKSDGTEAGTALLHDFDGEALAYLLTDVGGTLFFSADDGVHGQELWKSDGTEAGTVIVRDIRPGGASSWPHWAKFRNDGPYTSADADVAGTLYFAADDGTHGRELWRSDGTPAGTRMVQDIAPGPWDSAISDITVAGSRVFFGADRSTLGEPTNYELWVMELRRMAPGLPAASGRPALSAAPPTQGRSPAPRNALRRE